MFYPLKWTFATLGDFMQTLTQSTNTWRLRSGPYSFSRKSRYPVRPIHRTWIIPTTNSNTFLWEVLVYACIFGGCLLSTSSLFRRQGPVDIMVARRLWWPHSYNIRVPIFQHLQLSTDRVIEQRPSAELVILGEFNAHHTEWLSSQSTDYAGRCAHEFALAYGLSQLVHSSTIPDIANHTSF